MRIWFRIVGDDKEEVGTDAKEEIETDADDIAGLLEERGINPETVVVRHNSRIRTVESKLGKGDEVELIPVVSGG